MYEHNPDGQNPEVNPWTEIPNRREFEKITETEIGTALLRKGDLVALQYQHAPGTRGFTFDVTATEWENLGIGGSTGPHPTLRGRLDGAGLPPEVNGIEAVFAGSGWGGAAIEENVLGTGRSPYFLVPSGEYHAPLISDVSVFRKDENAVFQQLELRPMDEYSPTRELHRRRLQAIDAIMDAFGFGTYDIKDTATGSPFETNNVTDVNTHPTGLLGTYDDGRYVARYSAAMALGNRLAILDKQTASWLACNYFNYNQQDVLQVAVTDLKGYDLHEVFAAGNLAEYEVYAAGVAVTTFTTSGFSGLKAVNYKPDMQTAAATLQIQPIWPGNFLPRPDFQLFADGSVHIPLTYPFSLVEHTNPGMRRRLTEASSFRTDTDGSIELTIPRYEVRQPDPDRILLELAKVPGKPARSL